MTLGTNGPGWLFCPADRPERDLRKEALVQVLDGELLLMVTAQRHHDILAALRDPMQLCLDLFDHPDLVVAAGRHAVKAVQGVEANPKA